MLETKVTDEEIFSAMHQMPEFIDITPADFQIIYEELRKIQYQKFIDFHKIHFKSVKAGDSVPITMPTLLKKYWHLSTIFHGYTKAPARVGISEIFWSWLGSFLGIGLVAFLNGFTLPLFQLFMIVGSFGASAVLIYGAIKSPLAQPRNLIGGHLISALVGVTMQKIFPANPVLGSALAVSIAIAVMHFTSTLHPPGGATALIAVIGGEPIYKLGYLYLLFPTGSGVFLLLLVALLINNIPPGRCYPEYWL